MASTWEELFKMGLVCCAMGAVERGSINLDCNVISATSVDFKVSGLNEDAIKRTDFSKQKLDFIKN